jgi:hypothetical protein
MAATTAGETIVQRRRWTNVRLAAAAARRRRRARLSDPSLSEQVTRKIRGFLAEQRIKIGKRTLAESFVTTCIRIAIPRVSCNSQNGSQG